MDRKRDYYEVLGVTRDTDDAAVKKAFRALAVKYHPDRSAEPDAEERFKEIAEAYAVLSDPKKRADYDAHGHAGVAGLSPEDMFGGIDFEQIFGGHGLGFDFGGGGLFDRVFGRRAAPRRGADMEVRMAVPLERIATGGKESVHVFHPITCPACQGSGAKAGAAIRRCDKCDGSGQQVTRQQSGGMTVQRMTICPVCRGRGKIIHEICPECAGSGKTTREESLAVQIPAGIEDGTALRVAGHGLPGSEPGTPPGDLYVVVHAAPDPRFERRGADLWRVETVEIPDAVLGARITVPTLDGEVSVTLPSGTQPDNALRVAGKGLPKFGAAERGDLYLKIKVHVPERPSAEQRELYDRLRSLAGGRRDQSTRRNG